MTAFDYVVITVILASVALGVWRGVVGEVLALIAWILAFFAAKWCGDEFAHIFLASIYDPTLRIIAGWASVFFIVLLAMSIVRLAVSGFIKALGMGLSDRLLGVIFGMARGLVIVLAVVALAGATSLPKEQWWKEAYFSAPLETAVVACKPWLHPDIANKIQFE